MNRPDRRWPRSLIGPALVATVTVLAVAMPATARRELGPIVFASDRGGQLDIWAMAADGSNQVRLTDDKIDDVTPAWSNDGNRIAWARAGEIWVMNADGSGKSRVTFNTFGDFRPTWSPNGTRLAFRSLRGPDPDIYVINVDGTGEQQLTGGPGSEFAPDWSPDGSKIAYARQSGAFSGHFAVWVMDADGSNPHQLTPDSMEAASPGWSPDGSRILFVDEYCIDACGESDLFTMNGDGTDVTQITDTAYNELAKSWSRDSRRVVAGLGVVTPSDAHLSKNDIAVIDVATGATVNLTNSLGVSEDDPDWAP